MIDLVVNHVNSLESTTGYVYLVAGGGYHKIGKSKNWKSRIRYFNGFLPFFVTPVCIMHTHCMSRLENELHRKYKHRRIKGEWFRLTPEDVQEIKLHPLRIE